MTSRSCIHRLMFYMQSKEMYKLTPQLCRLARDEFHELVTRLPSDVSGDASFRKVLQLVQHVEASEFALAVELLPDAYKEHEEMISYLPRTPQKEPKVTYTYMALNVLPKCLKTIRF